METRFGSKYREVHETEGSRNRDSTVGLELIQDSQNTKYFQIECATLVVAEFETWASCTTSKKLELLKRQALPVKTVVKAISVLQRT